MGTPEDLNEYTNPAEVLAALPQLVARFGVSVADADAYQKCHGQIPGQPLDASVLTRIETAFKLWQETTNRYPGSGGT